MRESVNAGERQLLFRIALLLCAQAVRRISEIEVPAPAVDHVIGAVQFLALVLIGQNCNRAFGVHCFQSPDASPGVSCYGESSARIQSHSVRAWLPAIGIAALVSTWAHEQNRGAA